MKTLWIALLLVASTAHAEDPANTQAIEDAKSRIAFKMKDPESARFADVSVNMTGKTPLVCGWINAKNSFGGYVGFKPFYVLGTLAEVRDDASAGNLNNHITFDGAWSICKPGIEESFGAALVTLPKIDADKRCEKLSKTLGRPLGYDCPKLEAEARAWLESHGTATWIASRCSRAMREAGSYSSGRSCVEREEAEIVYSRGPALSR